MTQVDKLRDDFAREHPGASAEDLRLVQDLTGDIQSLDFSTPENVQDRSAATLKSLRKVFKTHIAACSIKDKLFTASMRFLTKFTFWLCQQSQLPLKTANQFLDDVYECIPLEEIRQFFTFIEKDLMTLEIVSRTTNNITLLKICNSLLKRLSKSTHNELRGRVHMLLASILALGDKSGLNKKSMINTTELHVVTRDQQATTTSTELQG